MNGSAGQATFRGATAHRPLRLPLRRGGSAELATPFALVAVAGVVVAPLVGGAGSDAEWWIALGLILGIVVAAAALPWQRWPPALQALPPLLYFVVIALVRDTTGAGSSVAPPLVLLPVVWLGLYGTSLQVAAGVGGVALTLATPLVLVGAPRYPPQEWARAGLFLMVAGLIAIALRQLITRLERLTGEDALTGLPNRRSWDEALRREVARAARHGPLCVALLDLDCFKAFNDVHGHQAGDRLLVETAAAWCAGLRGGDFLARYGGEEFAVLLPGCGASEARHVIDRVRAATPQPQTASAGLACWDGQEAGVTLVARADSALYRAKETGRDRTVVGSPKGEGASGASLATPDISPLRESGAPSSPGAGSPT